MLKSIGITHIIDNLGRVVIPIELRRALEINVGDYMEIYLENGKIVAQKYHKKCIFCGGIEGIIEINEKPICGDCLKTIKEMVE